MRNHFDAPCVDVHLNEENLSDDPLLQERCDVVMVSSDETNRLVAKLLLELRGINCFSIDEILTPPRGNPKILIFLFDCGQIVEVMWQKYFEMKAQIENLGGCVISIRLVSELRMECCECRCVHVNERTLQKPFNGVVADQILRIGDLALFEGWDMKAD